MHLLGTTYIRLRYILKDYSYSKIIDQGCGIYICLACKEVPYFWAYSYAFFIFVSCGFDSGQESLPISYVNYYSFKATALFNISYFNAPKFPQHLTFNILQSLSFPYPCLKNFGSPKNQSKFLIILKKHNSDFIQILDKTTILYYSNISSGIRVSFKTYFNPFCHNKQPCWRC